MIFLNVACVVVKTYTSPARKSCSGGILASEGSCCYLSPMNGDTIEYKSEIVKAKTQIFTSNSFIYFFAITLPLVLRCCLYGPFFSFIAKLSILAKAIAAKRDNNTKPEPRNRV